MASTGSLWDGKPIPGYRILSPDSATGRLSNEDATVIRWLITAGVKVEYTLPPHDKDRKYFWVSANDSLVVHPEAPSRFHYRVRVPSTADA